MIRIEDLIIDIDGLKLTQDEYKTHANNASAGIEQIVSGIKGISSLMFWAGANKDYEESKGDMQKIALLIEANMLFLERLREVESYASFKMSENKL